MQLRLMESWGWFGNREHSTLKTSGFQQQPREGSVMEKYTSGKF